MSTHLDSKEKISTTAVESAERLSFQALTERLTEQSSPPSLDLIQTWLENAVINQTDLEPYVGFKDGNYWRHRVCRNAAVEMLVLCWRPGHKTPIHDHNGSVGAVRVQAGLLFERMFKYDEVAGLSFERESEWLSGKVTGADLPDIHQLGNPENSDQDLITIHVYAPPLGVLKTYKVGSPQIDLYTPDDSGV